MYFVHEHRNDAGDTKIRRSSRFELVPMEVGGSPCESRTSLRKMTPLISGVFLYPTTIKIEGMALFRNAIRIVSLTKRSILKKLDII